MIKMVTEQAPNILARLLRRASRSDAIPPSVLTTSAQAREKIPALSFDAMEQAFLSEYDIRKQSESSLVLRDRRKDGLDAGSFHPPGFTILRLPLFVRDYLAKENLSQFWRADLPSDFLAWLFIAVPPFNKEAGDLIAYDRRINTQAIGQKAGN